MKTIKKILILILFCIFVFTIWQVFIKQVPMQGDWQEQLSILPTAEFNGDTVTVKNVRNFRYNPTEHDMKPAYYDKVYNLNEIKKVWFIAEPFNENKVAAHTFLSFEFNNGDFLSVSIEARKTKGQVYSIWKGFLRSYPLIYIAADERDTILLRANVRKDKVYVYPVRLSKEENAKILLTDMLNRMNELQDEKPVWYNTLFANCTSSIAYHVNKLSDKKISIFSWQLWLTASADELALKHGLLDTDLSIEKAREKFNINEISEKIDDVENYSKEIRGIK